MQHSFGNFGEKTVTITL